MKAGHDARKTFFLGLFVSLLLHVTASLTFFFNFKHEPRDESKPVAVQWLEKMPASQQANLARDQAGKHKPISSPHPIDVASLFRLTPPSNTQSGHPSENMATGQGAGNRDKQSFAGEGSFAVSDRMSAKNQVDFLPFAQALYDRLDKSIAYPVELHRTGQKGILSLEIEVDDKGILRGPFHNVRSENRCLKVYVLRNLEKALALALPQKNFVPLMRLGLKFDFDDQPQQSDSYGRDKAEQSPKISKNQFFFHRYGAPGGQKIDLNRTKDGLPTLGLKLNFDFDGFFSRDVRRATRNLNPDIVLEPYRRDPLYSFDSPEISQAL